MLANHRTCWSCELWPQHCILRFTVTTVSFRSFNCIIHLSKPFQINLVIVLNTPNHYHDVKPSPMNMKICFILCAFCAMQVCMWRSVLVVAMFFSALALYLLFLGVVRTFQLFTFRIRMKENKAVFVIGGQFFVNINLPCSLI